MGGQWFYAETCNFKIAFPLYPFLAIDVINAQTSPVGKTKKKSGLTYMLDKKK